MNRAEVELLLINHESALQPAEPEAVVIIITRLAAHFWSDPNRTSKHWDIVLEDYANHLSRYPLDLVASAAEDWLRHGKPFFPKISELVALIKPEFDLRWRNRKDLRKRLEPKEKPRPKPTDAEKAEISRLLENLRLVCGPPTVVPPSGLPARPVRASDEEKDKIFDKWGKAGGPPLNPPKDSINARVDKS